MIDVEPIGHIRTQRAIPDDDFWGGNVAEIELTSAFTADALAGLADFSHVEVIFVFDRVTPDAIVTGARHPRGNLAWPKVGIFAQRAKHRPNRLGVTVGRILGVAGLILRVAELDAIDGTPVLDIKPVMREFLPRGEVHQPSWATELMQNYWLKS